MYATRRSAAVRVLDLALADEDAQVRAVASALQEWHSIASKKHHTAIDQGLLHAALRKLHASLQPMREEGFSISTAKFHRARDTWQIITAYGGATYVSTDTYERSHKALKRVLPRCVPALLLLRGVKFIGSTVC